MGTIRGIGTLELTGGGVRLRYFETGWALLPLRLLIGFGLAAHGYAKLSRGPENFGAILASLGIPQPQFMAWATSLLEFLGGLSLIAGAFVVPLSLPLALVMLTAMLSVYLPYGFRPYGSRR